MARVGTRRVSPTGTGMLQAFRKACSIPFTEYTKRILEGLEKYDKKIILLFPYNRK